MLYCYFLLRKYFNKKTYLLPPRASETVRQVRQEPYHFLASGQLQLSPDYKAGSKRSRAITKEACNHVVYCIEAKDLLYKYIRYQCKIKCVHILTVDALLYSNIFEQSFFQALLYQYFNCSDAPGCHCNFCDKPI